MHKKSEKSLTVKEKAHMKLVMEARKNGVYENISKQEHLQNAIKLALKPENG